jgi:hypothetical protein
MMLKGAMSDRHPAPQTRWSLAGLRADALNALPKKRAVESEVPICGTSSEHAAGNLEIRDIERQN